MPGSGQRFVSPYTILLRIDKLRDLFIFIEVNRTGSPQGFSQVQISHKLNTIHTKHCTLHKRKIYKYNPKVSPFGIALVKKKRQNKLADAGTIDRFGLAVQEQIKKLIKKKNGHKQLQIKHSIQNA